MDEYPSNYSCNWHEVWLNPSSKPQEFSMSIKLYLCWSKEDFSRSLALCMASSWNDIDSIVVSILALATSFSFEAFSHIDSLIPIGGPKVGVEMDAYDLLWYNWPFIDITLTWRLFLVLLENTFYGMSSWSNSINTNIFTRPSWYNPELRFC